jgi:hypothetical protein
MVQEEGVKLVSSSFDSPNKLIPRAERLPGVASTFFMLLFYKHTS